jgi:Ran-binding protein 9/10
MPTGAPGLMPRRSSYASVVSGTASAVTQSYQQSARSGALSHLLSQAGELPYDSNYQHAGSSSRHNSRGADMDMHRNGGSYGGSSSWGRSGRLPSFSHAFHTFTNGYGYEGIGGHVDHFFIPSYLKGSKHVQRLEEAYRAKLAARKGAPSTQSSQPGSLSKSSSSANLHAPTAPSHRGITYDVIENRGMQYDVIEKAPPLEDESLAPLPSRWNNQDKYNGLEVQGDGQEVKYTGTRSSERDHEASSIRTDHPIPPQCGIYYFEVTILSRKREEYAPLDVLSSVT